MKALYILTLALLAGCATINTEEASGLPTRQDQVILVGRFDMTPAIPQHFPNGPQQPYQNVVENRILTTFAINPSNERADFRSLMLSQNADAVPVGRTFFITVPRAQIFLNSGVYLTHVPTAYGLNGEVFLPGGLSTSFPAHTDVVYVGTVRYTRGNFYEITNVNVVDEFAATRSEIVQKFGTGTTIAKALWAHRP